MNGWLEAEQRVERAQQFSESQRWEEALAEIDVALSINPNNATWHAHRGYILEELERWEDAAEAYQDAHELEPGDCEVSVALGAALARLARFSKALEIFEELAGLFPDFEPAYCYRIRIYAELGRHEQAEEMFYLAQELDESCPYCFFHMGASLAARGQFDRAIYCWQRVLELYPEHIGVNRSIAQAYREQGKLDVARDYYLREVRDDPGNTELLYELAELTAESGEITMAAARFSQIVELDPEHAAAHFALGRICLLRGQPERALAFFEKIESITHGRPDLPGFKARVGEAMLRLGRFTEARKQLEAAVADEDDGGEPTAALVLLGTCLLVMNKVAEAGDTFRRVLALDADHPVAHHRLGVCLVHRGRHAAGLEHCLRAIQAKPDFVAAMHTALLAHLHLAQWREARSMLRRALRRDPDNTELAQLGKRFWRYRLLYYAGRLIALFSQSTRNSEA